MLRARPDASQPRLTGPRGTGQGGGLPRGAARAGASGRAGTGLGGQKKQRVRTTPSSTESSCTGQTGRETQLDTRTRGSDREAEPPEAAPPEREDRDTDRCRAESPGGTDTRASRRSRPAPRRRRLRTHLGAPGQGDDAGEQVPDHCLEAHAQALHVDGVDETQAVLQEPEDHGSSWRGPVPRAPPRAPAARLTLNTSTWSNRDTNTRVLGAKSWPAGPDVPGESRPEPPSSASSSRPAASSAHTASCGHKPFAWLPGRSPEPAGGPGQLPGGPATDRRHPRGRACAQLTCVGSAGSQKVRQAQ